MFIFGSPGDNEINYLEKKFHNPLIPLFILLIISSITHFPFVLKGFGELDATKIAVSVIDLINHGSNAAFANFYFTDVIPLYIVFLKSFMKVLKYDYALLPIVMNFTNAVVGSLIIIPAFLLIRNLFTNSAIAFYSVLALIFAPSFYQSTIIGFPHLIALFFLFLSLCFFLAWLDRNRGGIAYLWCILACVFLTVTFLFKSDYVLASGIYFGLLFMRKVKDKSKIISTFLMIFISGILFLIFRDLMLGSTSGTTMSKGILEKCIGIFRGLTKKVSCQGHSKEMALATGLNHKTIFQ